MTLTIPLYWWYIPTGLAIAGVLVGTIGPRFEDGYAAGFISLLIAFACFGGAAVSLITGLLT